MSSTDPKLRFSETVSNYNAYRPGYPSELLDWILQTSSLRAGAEVADVGCGTGISSRLFAARGYSVLGIEPNDKMRDAAEARGGGPKYRKGDAGATGLGDGSVDLVAAAQAFHWFDVPSALAEFKRILRPNGWCAAFWNDRTEETAFLREYERLLASSSTEYRELRGKDATLEAIRASPSARDWTQASFPNSQSMDRDAFFGRVNSSSYVVHGVKDKAAFDAALESLFGRHQTDGRVEFRYDAIGACWRL